MEGNSLNPLDPTESGVLDIGFPSAFASYFYRFLRMPISAYLLKVQIRPCGHQDTSQSVQSTLLLTSAWRKCRELMVDLIKSYYELNSKNSADVAVVYGSGYILCMILTTVFAEMYAR